MTEPAARAIPALAAYIDRVGAEELNFRRFIVREYGRSGYYTETCLIKINSDGTISCNKKEYEPTKEEAEAIKLALASTNFPVAVHAQSSHDLRQILGTDAILYEFWDRRTNELRMVQQRVQFPNGRKTYLPWTFFSDAKWRCMEPDGDLPFWKPRNSRNLLNIMVHEGAKPAAFADDLVNNPTRRAELDAHPFREDLICYEHWGLIGGALAPHRADYAELRREAPKEIVYICDNDFAGKEVLTAFSRHYRKPMKGVMFTDMFDEHWDLADPIPKNLFHTNGNYIGPSLRHMMRYATWATEKLPNPAGKGPSIAILTKDFKQEWMHCVTPDSYIHVDWPNRIYNASEFNDICAPYSDVIDTALLIKRDETAKHLQIIYSPALPKGIFADDSGSFINTHVESEIRPKKGDPARWLAFMEHLCPEAKDRLELMRWCATLIARPAIRMHYGVLAISETQGVGKGTLGEKILAPLVGRANCSTPAESEILDSAYNYWISHKRLAVVHEIYQGSSSRPYNKLKSAITDQRITVSRKYLANYEIDNWIHIFACSNSPRALKLSTDDRRWFVPRIVEGKQPTKYWQELNDWLTLEGGLSIIRYWAEEFLQYNEPVRTGNPAPDSTLKREVIEEGLSPGQELVLQTLNSLKDQLDNSPATREQWQRKKFLVNGGNIFVLDRTLVDLIRQYIYDGRQNDRLERPHTVRKLAKSNGWFIGEARIGNIKHWGPYRARVIATSRELANMPPKEINELGGLPIPLTELYEQQN